MMRFCHSPRYLVGFLFLAALGPQSLSAAPQSAAELMPKTTLLYAELRSPGALVDGLLGHPLRDEIESLPGVQDAYKQPSYQQVKAVVGLIESQLGHDWQELVSVTTGRGVAIGLDAETEGVALLLGAADETTQQELVTAIVNLARQDAENKNNPDPVGTGEYRGVTAYKLDKSLLAVFGHWLLVTNKSDLGKNILDRFFDEDPNSLASSGQFAAARQSAEGADAWGYVNVAGLRDAGAAKKLFQGQAENPLAELLVGGILSNLQKTSHVTATLNLTQERVRLELAAPHSAEWVPEPREYFFGIKGEGVAPPLLGANNRVFALSAYRDVSAMWLQAGDLFDERTNDEMAKAESNLSTLFSGKDFGEEILGAVRPHVQLVVARQEFDAAAPQPAIKLPAFALALELKDPGTMRRELRRTFQSLIGFLNVVGAMNGQPQLDLGDEQQGESEIVTATYLPDKEESDLKRLPINFNFSPSVAFVEDRVILSSTKPLAQELVQATGSNQAATAGRNTAAAADFQSLRTILNDNRRQLIAQNMLEKGHSREEAEFEIDTLLTLVGFLHNATLQLATDSGTLRLAVEVQLNCQD